VVAFLHTSRPGLSEDGFLSCMSPDAAGALRWKIFFGIRLFSPILADLDGLGHLELFQPTGDGFLYMLDQLALQESP